MGKFRDVWDFKDNLFFMCLFLWCLACEKLLSFVLVFFFIVGNKKVHIKRFNVVIFNTSLYLFEDILVSHIRSTTVLHFFF